MTSNPVPPVEEIIQYRARSGELFDFYISKEKCDKFCFYPNTRVVTPKGPATVIGVGVKDSNLWVHIDGESGGSFWENAKNYEELLKVGFYQWDPEMEKSEGDYHLKKIEYKGKQIKILLQNENGPCPLIAIANILALRSDISLESSNTRFEMSRISVKQISEIISNFIKKQLGMNPSEEEVKQFQEITKMIPSLQYGLDVNCGFKSCDDFMNNITNKSLIFDFLDIRMLHGWILDPADKVIVDLIGGDAYEDLTLRLVSAESEFHSHEQSSNTNAQSHPTKLDSPSKSNSPKFSKDEAKLIREWLDSNSHQLTHYGLQQLHKSIKEDELVVFFRNNHFSTLTRNNGKLFILVTDIGYEKERNVVWDELSTVLGGDSQFYNGLFQTVSEVKLEEIRNTADAFGFSKDKIEEAITKLSSTLKIGEELKVDDVLAWLNTNYPLP